MVLQPVKAHHASGGHGQSGKRPVYFIAGQDFPADTGDFIGHGNECDVWVTPLFKLLKPLPHTRLLSFHVNHKCTSALNQQHPKVTVTSLADTPQIRFATCRILLGHQTQPCRQISTVDELLVTCFLPLYQGNAANLKWKRFLFSELGKSKGLVALRPPGCQHCDQLLICFPN